MGTYTIGEKVRINSENDNECYNEFRDTILTIVDYEVGGVGYDIELYPQKLMSLETADGVEVPFSLYEYEIDNI